MSLGRMALGWRKDGSLASECIKRMKNLFYRATPWCATHITLVLPAVLPLLVGVSHSAIAVDVDVTCKVEVLSQGLPLPDPTVTPGAS